MPVTCREDNRCLTALVSGELDHHGARAVMNELDQRIDQAQPRELTLDLSGMTQVRGAMRVVSTPAQAGKVFRAAGLERIIRFE